MNIWYVRAFNIDGWRTVEEQLPVFKGNDCIKVRDIVLGVIWHFVGNYPMLCCAYVDWGKME